MQSAVCKHIDSEDTTLLFFFKFIYWVFLREFITFIQVWAENCDKPNLQMPECWNFTRKQHLDYNLESMSIWPYLDQSLMQKYHMVSSCTTNFIYCSTNSVYSRFCLNLLDLFIIHYKLILKEMCSSFFATFSKYHSLLPPIS